MGIFTWLCCIPSSPSPPPSASSQPRHHATPTTINTPTHDPNHTEETGYTSPPDLPAYTPRPISIHEKTLALHMRDPPISSSGSTAPDQQTLEREPGSYPDEKAQYYAYDHDHDQDSLRNPPPRNSNRPEDLSSDVSSAISFTSSYGNTSTATRETPPPPYSPREGSPVPGAGRRSRSRSGSSVSGLWMGLVGHGHGGGPGGGGGIATQMMQIAQPRPVFQRRETLMRSLVARRSGEEY